MSTIASHSPLNILETVRAEALFKGPPIGNGLWGNLLVMLLDQVNPKRSNLWPQYA